MYTIICFRIYWIGDTMFTFLKGILIGIGKIIPGVSGSLIAISLGVYEKCIDIISNFFVEIRYNFKFLFLLCSGIIVSILFGSNLIYYFLTNYYFLTMCLFIGLIAGTIPNVFKKNKIIKRQDYFYITIPFIIMIIISSLGKGSIEINNNLSGYMLTIIIGFIDAFTMIVPGISGTAIFIMLGVYEFVLLMFGNLLLPYLIFFMLGIVIGIYVTSKIINYCFKNYNRETYLIILGFLLSSLIFIIIDTFSKGFNIINLIIGFVLVILGYFISYFFDNK